VSKVDVPFKSYEEWMSEKSLKQYGRVEHVGLTPDQVEVEREAFNRRCRKNPDFAFKMAMTFYRKVEWYD
jgi:hypothetical protein